VEYTIQHTIDNTSETDQLQASHPDVQLTAVGTDQNESMSNGSTTDQLPNVDKQADQLSAEDVKTGKVVTDMEINHKSTTENLNNDALSGVAGISDSMLFLPNLNNLSTQQKKLYEVTLEKLRQTERNKQIDFDADMASFQANQYMDMRYNIPMDYSMKEELQKGWNNDNFNMYELDECSQVMPNQDAYCYQYNQPMNYQQFYPPGMYNQQYYQQDPYSEQLEY